MFSSTKEIILFKEPGISIDINVFFRDERNVSSFKIHTDDEKYFVDVELTNSTKDNVDDIFHSFVKYMQYSNIVCYQKSVSPDCITFEFITANNEMKGFCCHISFR